MIEDTEAYQEGYTAYILGNKLNPHSNDTFECVQWEVGWSDAADDNQKDATEYFMND